jgi:hypothetical protein
MLLVHELLLFSNYLHKDLGAAYTCANTASLFVLATFVHQFSCEQYNYLVFCFLLFSLFLFIYLFRAVSIIGQFGC